MTRDRPLRNKGFSIVELMVTATLLVLVIGGSLRIFAMSQTAWSEGNARMNLQRRASIAVEQMVKGTRGAGEARWHGIREANVFALPNGNRIDYSSPFDTITRSFYLNGTGVVYDPDITVLNNEEVIYDLAPGGNPADYTTQLTFTQVNARLVQIALVVSQRVRDKWIRASYETNVDVRNRT